VLETDKVGGFYSPDIIAPRGQLINLNNGGTVYATTTLKVSDSGATLLLSGTGTTIMLPKVGTKGTTYRFVVNGALGIGNVMVTSTEGDNIQGSVIVAGAVVDCDAADALNFIVDGENIGDYFEIISTGTHWVPLSSGVLTASKLTCTG
jgi:hypothetical protein